MGSIPCHNLAAPPKRGTQPSSRVVLPSEVLPAAFETYATATDNPSSNESPGPIVYSESDSLLGHGKQGDLQLDMAHSTGALEKQLPGDVEPLEESARRRREEILGTLFILCASALFSGMHTSVRYASENFSLTPLFLAFFRGLVQTTLTTSLVVALGFRRLASTFTRRTFFLMCCRGILGACAMVCKYFALSKLPVGVSVALFSTTPVFATLLGVLLGESFRFIDFASLLFCVSGALCVAAASPSDTTGALNSDHLLGILFGLTGATITATVFVILRRMGTRVHFLFNTQAHGFGSLLVPLLLKSVETRDVGSALGFFSKNLIQSLAHVDQLVTILCLGLFSFGAALFLNKSLQLIGAGRAATMRTLDIPINFLTGFLVMGERPDAFGQILGCILITIGIYIVATKPSR